MLTCEKRCPVVDVYMLLVIFKPSKKHMHCVLRVACRQMGFPDGFDIFTGNERDADSPMILDGVRCAGNESFFLACRSNLYFSSTCTHSQDVYVKCMCRNCTKIGERV